MLCRLSFLAGVSLALLAAKPVQAQTNPPPDTLSPICTDRPTKSNYACTVDVGHWQYESDIVNESTLRQGGITTDTWLVFNPTLKYGLSSSVDVEANFSPLEIIHSSGGTTAPQTITGVSDLYLRLKYKFLNSDSGNLQATLLPYIKAPTARAGLGNGAVEGGVIMPVNYKLTDTLTLSVDPELDADKDAIGSGHHLNTAQLINLGWSLPNNFTWYGELWGDWSFDKAGTVRQYSADAALAYGITPYLQVDVGLNIGLNRATPGTQAYLGLSQKF